jgi:hypothetical protein
MPPERLAEQKEEIYAAWVADLVALKEKMFTLSSLGETNVDGKPAVGVKVSSKGHRDINLYFDKETGLLAKSETRVKDEMLGGQEVGQETFYSDYKEVQGVKVAMKAVIKRDGKLYVEADTTEYIPAEKLDDNLFLKP